MFLFRLFCALFALISLGSPGSALAAPDYNQLSINGEAISGYDVVAYRQGDAPIRGTRAYSIEWRGAVWLFASAGNLATFKSAPERYAPAFGGYCAYAISRGIKADIHPFIYKIVNDKLFLFYSFESRDKFFADPANIRAAESEWAVIGNRLF